MKLLFVHGSGGCRESWKYQTEHFEGAEAVNLPGHPDGDLCPTIEAYAAWLHDYIRQAGHENVVLAGHSLGGGIALQYALEHASNLSGIVLVGSGAKLRVIPALLEGLESAIENSDTAFGAFDQIYDGIEPGLAEILKARAAENGLASLLNDLRACDRFNVMERLNEIKVPLLAICGEQDLMTPPKYAKFLVDRLSEANVHIIPGGTHMVHAEEPDAVNQAIDAFVGALTND